MKKFPIVLDLETKKTFREEPDTRKLGITVVGIYDYRDNTKKVFTETELGSLFSLLESSSYIVGYNVKSFDIQVLQGYYPGKVEDFHIFDIMDDIREKIGRRLALNDVAATTLGKKKSGHGLQAIDFYREGKWEELKQYCLDDVIITRELFDYGIKNGEIYYLNEVGKVPVKVDWQKYMVGQENADMPLTLPF